MAFAFSASYCPGVGLISRLALAAMLGVGCGGAGGPSSPAADGVREYLNALKSDNPRDAYDMLAGSARGKLSFDEFAIQWKETAKERKWQAQLLEDSLKGNPDVGERAMVTYNDGKLVHLERDGKSWRLESELVGRSRAKKPRDAIVLFSDAIAARDLGGVLGVLTKRRREGLTKQIEGFVTGIGKRINDTLDQSSSERAELRWDEGGIRYRIVLLKEGDEWYVDDIIIRPAPKQPDGEGGDDGLLPEDF